MIASVCPGDRTCLDGHWIIERPKRRRRHFAAANVSNSTTRHEYAIVIPVPGTRQVVRHKLTRRMRVERRIGVAHANNIAVAIKNTAASGGRHGSRRRGYRGTTSRVIIGRR
jgi:flagellar biosynthesis/type III secretory pathway ATPase